MVSQVLLKYLRTRYPKREERRELSESWFRNEIYKCRELGSEFNLKKVRTNPLNPRSS